MAITTLDQLINAAAEDVRWLKTASMTTVSGIPFSPFAQAGNPGAGTLAGVSTTTGSVPVDTDAGFPPIAAFGGANLGYIASFEFSNTAAGRITVYDLLWKGGAYAFNASTTGNTPASFASRIPGGNYAGTELFLEQVTAATGIQSVAVTYTNQSGTGGRSTGTVSQGTAGIVGRMTKLPLQAGDSGVQGVTGVVGSIATVGTFNILVMRKLVSGRINASNGGDTHDFLRTKLTQIYSDSALYFVVQPDGTSSGIPEVMMSLRNG